MKLDINFNPNLKKTIKLCEPLSDWFERNQETMAYFQLTHKGCLHFEGNPFANNDIIVLGKMANAALTWLEMPKTNSISRKEIAINAALAIAMIYEKEKEKLSDNAKMKYYIDVQNLQKNINEEKVLKKILINTENDIN